MENWIRSNVVVQESEDALFYFVDKGNLEKIKGTTGQQIWSKPVENTNYILSTAQEGGILLARQSNKDDVLIKHFDQNGSELNSQTINHTGEFSRKHHRSGERYFIGIGKNNR